MRAPIANRWTPFGLERDPFFQNELSADDEALYPASAFFVARADELERVATTVGSGVSSATVVEGDAGVGKTSFVNALKARLAAGGALTHEQPIRVFDDTTFHGLVTEVLRTLLEIRATQLDAGVPRFRKASARSAQLWDKVATIAEGNTRRGGSLARDRPRRRCLTFRPDVPHRLLPEVRRGFRGPAPCRTPPSITTHRSEIGARHPRPQSP